MTQKSTEVDARKTESTRDLPVSAPATDIYETEREIVVVVDMPGVGEQQVEVTLENQELTLSGRAAADAEGGEMLYREFGPAEFRRSFTLSDEIDREKIAARVKNGVLRVVLPKAAKAAPRRINVQTET